LGSHRVSIFKKSNICTKFGPISYNCSNLIEQACPPNWPNLEATAPDFSILS
jgi:hypothetical protein